MQHWRCVANYSQLKRAGFLRHPVYSFHSQQGQSCTGGCPRRARDAQSWEADEGLTKQREPHWFHHVDSFKPAKAVLLQFLQKAGSVLMNTAKTVLFFSPHPTYILNKCACNNQILQMLMHGTFAPTGSSRLCCFHVLSPSYRRFPLSSANGNGCVKNSA